MPTFKLTEDQRRQIDAAIAGLTGDARRRERARLRSRLLREYPEYRKKDNAAKRITRTSKRAGASARRKRDAPG